MLPIEILFRVLLQVPAITAGGGVSAEWVMVGITTVAIFLFWRMLYKIETGLDRVAMSVAVHETRLSLNEQSIEQLEEKVKAL